MMSTFRRSKFRISKVGENEPPLPGGLPHRGPDTQVPEVEPEVEGLEDLATRRLMYFGR